MSKNQEPTKRVMDAGVPDTLYERLEDLRCNQCGTLQQLSMVNARLGNIELAVGRLAAAFAQVFTPPTGPPIYGTV